MSGHPAAETAEREEFLRIQRETFSQADEAHYLWQTRNPAFARTERGLLAGLFGPVTRFLEVGCGEGANLTNLFEGQPEPEVCVGVDLFHDKVRFASTQVPHRRFICADGQQLPFRDGAFDAILCRDVLHHVDDPERLVGELARLCAPGGIVVCLEPNRLNLLMGAVGLLRPFERGILKSSARRLRALIGERFEDVTLEYRQPLPLSRLVLHHQFGLPRLGHAKWIDPVLRTLEAPARLVPSGGWAYMCVRATQPRSSTR